MAGRTSTRWAACSTNASSASRRSARDSELGVVFAHLETEPPAASVERPDVVAALDPVIARALAKQPEQRFASCGEFARAALAVSVDEASRLRRTPRLGAAAGQSGLTEVEAELAGKVSELQLVRVQERALSDADAAARVAAEGICPFKGLASFEPGDAEYFFGRERLVAELVTRLVVAGFLGIVGPSGSGKLSVLRAGFSPASQTGSYRAARAGGVGCFDPASARSPHFARHSRRRPRIRLQKRSTRCPKDTRLLLAVDQLEEELFTARRYGDERAAFADTLARVALADPGGRAVVVVALRAQLPRLLRRVP